MDKAAKVDEYLNKIYTNNAGVTMGVLANDTGLDDTLPFKVNIVKE